MKIQQLATLFCLAASIAIAQPVEVTDAGGETVVIHSAERIVSLNGSTTEILFALGVGKRSLDAMPLLPIQNMSQKHCPRSAISTASTPKAFYP